MRRCYYPHCADEETKAQGVNEFIHDELVGGRTLTPDRAVISG